MKKEDLAKLTRQELSAKIGTGEIPVPMVFEALREGIITTDPNRFGGDETSLVYIGNGDGEPPMTPRFKKWFAEQEELLRQEQAAEAAKKKGDK